VSNKKTFTSRRNPGAVSVLEVLVTVAAIAILVAIASPYYEDYKVRTKVAEGFKVLNKLKEQSQNYHTKFGTFPTLSNLGESNTAYSSEVVSWGDMGSRGWTGGDSNVPFVEVQYTSDTVPGQTAPRLAYVVTKVEGNIVFWTCFTYETSSVESSINPKFLPPACRIYQQ